MPLLSKTVREEVNTPIATSRQLDDYSVETLQNLQLAIAIAMEKAIELDAVLFGADIALVSNDITEALKDKQFELNRR